MPSDTVANTTSSGVTYRVTTNTNFLGMTTSWDVVITGPDGSTSYDGRIYPVSGQVITGSDFSFTLANLLVGGTYVVPPGASGEVNIAVQLGTAFPTTMYIGGEATITTGLSGLSGLDISVDGGTATLASGIVGSALNGTTVTISHGGRFANGNSLINALTGTRIAFGPGGGTLTLNAGGAVLELTSTTITGYNPSETVIELQNSVAPVAQYTISGSGTSRVITLIGSDGNTISRYAVNMADGVSLPTGSFVPGSSQSNPLRITYSDGNTYVGVCFLAGALIGTPQGPRAVETLCVGDDVFVFRGTERLIRKIRWTGCATTQVDRDRPDDLAGYPVRICRDALAEGTPSRDLLVTPDHALFFEGVLIPARMLVNGRSIYFDRTITQYSYFHIETDDHAVIMANDLLTESYLDTGNRHVFRQKGKIATLPGRKKSWSEDAAARLATERALVEPVHERLRLRAEALDFAPQVRERERTDDPDLHLVDERGRKIRQARRTGRQSVFMIPDRVRFVRLVSRTMRPSETEGPFVDDRRRLGVLVGRIGFFDAGGSVELTAHLGNAALPGWESPENASCRWTRGEALLDLGVRERNSIGVLSIEILSNQRYPVTEDAHTDMVRIA